jgi:hypothetical protein
MRGGREGGREGGRAESYLEQVGVLLDVGHGEMVPLEVEGVGRDEAIHLSDKSTREGGREGRREEVREKKTPPVRTQNKWEERKKWETNQPPPLPPSLPTETQAARH